MPHQHAIPALYHLDE